MAWNGPPPQYGPHANAFWDFARAFDPSGRGFGGPGGGVDRTPGGGDPRNFFFGGGGPGGHPFFGSFGGPPPFGTFGGPWPPRQSNEESESENDETAARAVPSGTQQAATGEEDVSMNEKDGSPETVREGPTEGEHPAPPHHPGHHHPHGHHGRHHHGGPGPNRGCRGGRGGMRGQCRHAPYGGPGPHHAWPPVGGAWPLGGGAWPFGGGNGWFGGGGGGRGGGRRGGRGGAWDFDPVIQALASHPYAQNLRDYIDRASQRAAAAAENSNTNNEESGTSGAEGAGAVDDDDIETFTPPVDTFRTSEGGWVLHFALPGAKKEDVGVHWDADRGTLTVSGVVYRPGSEEFLRGLVAGERSVGVFRREVRLPPPEKEEVVVAYREKEKKEGEKDEVDGEGITARMEDGVLLVRVPTVEREWTEVRKVDIL
ncbi:uncharacterized protein E0L32_001028 [Thyridium curvatum]|uniref:SHSP domain-containing protein n=1 Tax=Thyridium curvatum TaxID=1093900 RepID=A0A507B3N1_9PEZI|nr:uncharacterized protein E0L32_001028 [Thyridium curvatum]TPX11210.1 hypothetical protein E0L32_001028 [Thyridium curvatum]